MTKSNENTFYRYGLNALKIGVSAFAVWYIYRQVFVKHDFDYFFDEVRERMDEPGFFMGMLLVFFMMFFNWAAESMKWKILLKKMENISLTKSIEAVLAGVTVSFFTPNRIGEFGARVLFLKKANKIKAAISTIFGSMCQLMITVIFGCIGLIFFVNREYHPDDFLFYSVAFLTLILSVLMVFFYYNFPLIKQFGDKIGWLKKVLRWLDFVSDFTFTDLSLILGLSVFRYVVFSFQLFFLFRIFGVHIPLSEGLGMIFLCFLVMAVPTIALLDFGVRGTVTTYFVGFLSPNEAGILMAVFFLWLINLAIPAAVGIISLLRVKISLRLHGSD